VQGCEKAIAELRKIGITSGSVIDPFCAPKDRIRKAFERDEKPLFQLPGALGQMLNPQLKLKRFVAILAKAKSGKTALLYYLALVAKRCGLDVALFAAGDEDEDSSILRFATILKGKNPEKEFCGKHALPVMDCDRNQTGMCQLKKRLKRCTGAIILTDEERKKLTPEELLEKNPDHVPCTCCRNTPHSLFKPAIWYKVETVDALGWVEATRAFRRFQKVTPNRHIRLFTYDSDTLTVAEMERRLDVEEDNTGWVPTVVIGDYPDLFADENPREHEFRHKENKKWKAMRGFSQRRNVLLIVVTQSNMTGYRQTSLNETNVNEDRRKLDHVTWLGAIHQTAIEKRKRVARFGPLVQRKGLLVPGRQVVLLQALEKGRLYRDSFFAMIEDEAEKD
jgi:hypothetical protein